MKDEDLSVTAAAITVTAIEAAGEAAYGIRSLIYILHIDFAIERILRSSVSGSIPSGYGR